MQRVACQKYGSTVHWRLIRCPYIAR